MSLIVGIIALIAIGCLIAYAIALSIKWIRNKVKEKLESKKTSKVAVAEIEHLLEQAIAESENTTTLAALDKLVDEGHTHILVGVDVNGNVIGDVELIKDENDQLDDEVNQLLGRERLVIIEG
jgi:hypothetical protein